MNAAGRWALRVTGWSLRLALGLVALVLTLPLVVWALAHNEWACERLLAQVPGLTIVQPQGALLGDFRAQRLEVALPRGGRLSLQDLHWQGLGLRLDADAPWHVGLVLQQLEVKRLNVAWVAGPKDPSPTKAPASLILPVSVALGRVQIDEAHGPWWGAEPLRALDASAALGQSSHQHTLTLRHLAWSHWTTQGSVSVAERGRMPVTATLQAEGALPKVGQGQATVNVQGPLNDLLLKVQGSWQPAAQTVPIAQTAQAKAQPQTLDAQASVHAFEPWPLASLQLKLQALDLAPLGAGLPHTALTGEVRLAPQGQSGLTTHLQVRNDLAAAWDAQGLPVQLLQGDVSLPMARQANAGSQAWLLGQAQLQLRVPSEQGRAPGSVEVRGGWGEQRALVFDVRALEPRALHAQAPPLQLSGQVTLTPRLSTNPAGHIDWQLPVLAALQGLYAEPPAAVPGKGLAGARTPITQPVALSLAGQLLPEQASVQRLSLQSGPAKATLSDVLAAWPAGQPWRVNGAISLDAFDPRVWLPWPAEVVGVNRLSGQAKGQLDGQWRGQLDVQVSPSQIAGLPLHGQVQWRSPASAKRMDLDVKLDVAGNRAQAHAVLPWDLDAQGTPRLNGQAQWQGEVHAPALQALQAMAPLMGGKRVAGAIEAQVHGSGQWPVLQADGDLSVKALVWQAQSGTTLSLASLVSQWQLDTRGSPAASKLNAQVDVAQLQSGAMVLEQLQAHLQGNMASHAMTVSAQAHRQGAKGQPPSDPVRLDAALQGALTGALAPSSAPGAWQGQLRELVIRSVGKQPRTFLQARPTELRWQRDARSESVLVKPTQLTVMDAELALQSMRWQWPDRSSDALGQVDIDLRLLPLNLPKVLATWQPQAGWGGDLMVAGQLKLSHSQSQPWVVDAQVARQSGDISLSEPTIEGSSPQKLGISQAQVMLQARQGVWTLTESFNGRLLGAITGRQVVQARSADQWPSGGDRLLGELDAQISNLRPWGAWMPAGWRVSGQVQAKAQLSGTLAAPEYRGQVHGENLGAGQALLGINLTEGQLDVALQGAQATLTKLVAKGGNQGGTVSAVGEANFGESPTANVRLSLDRFALLQRVDRRVVVSGQAQMALGAEDIKVDGSARVDEGLIDISRSDAPTVGDDVNVLHRPGQAPEDEASAPDSTAPKRKANIHMDLDLGSALKLKGHGLDATLGGVLKFTTPNNRPTLQGTVRVDRGTFAAYGQKLLIDRGSIAFTGPVENPRLDILAMRAQSASASSSDVKVGVTITGTAQDPRVRLYSDPSMSETEKLSWLVLGRAPTGLGGADLGLLQSAAVALLSGEGTSPTDNLIGLLGLDELSVKQSEGTVRDTVVNVGKQVSKYWYVGYERNLTATGGNWQLIYRLAQRFTLRAQAGVDNAVDFIWSWRWD